MNYNNNNIIITYMQYTDEQNLKKFGELVKKIRIKKATSLNKTAFSRGGVTSATLSRIENGLVDFKFSTLIKLAYTLDVSLLELLKDYQYKNFEDI